MNGICGANCDSCMLSRQCGGCEKSCGKPFGGSCTAYEYIKLGGIESYNVFKEQLRREINTLLRAEGLPEADALYELAGSYVNLAYPMPNGNTVKLLDDTKVYLGCQIELDGSPRCIGAIADTTLIILTSYAENGTEPELLLYKKR